MIDFFFFFFELTKYGNVNENFTYYCAKMKIIIKNGKKYFLSFSLSMFGFVYNFSVLFLKLTSFPFYIWEKVKYFKFDIFSIKSKGITTITNTIQENSNATLNFFSSLWCTNNNFFKKVC